MASGDASRKGSCLVGELATEQASYHATDHMADDGNHFSGWITAVGRIIHFKLDNE